MAISVVNNPAVLLVSDHAGLESAFLHLFLNAFVELVFYFLLGHALGHDESVLYLLGHIDRKSFHAIVCHFVRLPEDFGLEILVFEIQTDSFLTFHVEF